jgi:hypothetical protein
MVVVVTDCCGVRSFGAQVNAVASGSRCRTVAGHAMTVVSGHVDRCSKRHHHHYDGTAVYDCADAYVVRLLRVRIDI